ncbi:hypothetical protein [Sphingomonas sp. Marseille-Q8236]
MAANVVLVEARPRSAGDGAAVTVRLAGCGGSYPYFYDNAHWKAGIAGLPRTIASLDFDGEQLGGGGVPQAMELGWSPATRAALADVAALYWADAPITVRIGPEGDALPPIAASGLVLDGAVEGGSLRIALSDAAAELKKPLLNERFLGTGGIEGPVELENIIKSRSWGRCFNVPGQLIERANNIWCFGDPRRAWQRFVQVRDRGVAATEVLLLAWQGTPEATFAALKGAAAPEGGCVVCPSIACVKWWSEPAGDLKADIEGETAGGYVETAPEIVARLVAVRSAIPIAAGAVAEARAWRPAPYGSRVDNESTTAADAISEVLGDVSLSWLLIGGAIRFRRWEWTASTRVARSHRVSRRSTVKPVATRKLGYRRNWSPMARGDLAAIVLATDVAYEDGTPVEALKPAQPGADKTADHPEAFVQWTGRPAADVVADLNQNILNVAAEMVVNGTWRAGTDQILFVDGKPIRQVIEQIALTQEGLSLFVTQLQEVNANTGTARFMFAANANGDIVGIQGTAGGKISGLSFVAGRYQFVDPNGGNAINALVYDEDDVWRLRKVEVTEIKADTVITKHLVTSSISQTRVAPVSGNISIARNASANVASVSMTKQEPDSVMKVTFFGMFQSDDDIQMTCTVEVDGATSYPAGRINNVFDSTQSKAESTLTPFVYIYDLPAGDHTFVFKVVNQEVDNIALIVKMGSAMEVLEQKRPLL